MSRAWVALAALAFALSGLAPIAVMAARIGPGDLADLADGRTLVLLGRTLGYGLGVALLALAVGAPFGFLVARTDMPGARWLRPLGIVPLFLPPMLIAMTWTVLLDARGAPAAIGVSVLSTFPLVALFTARAFERIDGRLEDAARLWGGARAVLRADLGLVLPAALCGACLAFAFTVNDFSVPDYVSWVGPKFNVYADEVFAAWKLESRPGRAVALALPLVALTLATLIPALALRRKGAMGSLASGFRPPEPLRLGVWRWPAALYCMALLALAVAVPFARLAFEAGGGSRGFTPSHWRTSFARALELARGDLQNSLLYALAAATLATPIGLLLGHALERARRGRLLEPLALLPIAVPAVLFAIGAIATWNHPGLEALYDGGGMVVLLLVGRFVAFPVLLLAGAVAMLDPALEEAARLAGARPGRRLLSIVAPPLAPALIGSWVLVFVLSLRELDAMILVPAANHTAMFRVFNAVHFGRDDFVAAIALLLCFLILLPGALWASFGRRRLEVLP